MDKNRLTEMRDYIMKNLKLIIPGIVILVVAVIVSFALGAASRKQDNENGDPSGVNTDQQDGSQAGEVNQGETGATGETGETPQETAPKEVPLVANTEEQITNLVNAYYDSMASGDSAAMASLYDELTENEQLRCEEMAKYLDHISNVEIYTKDGLTEGTSIIYVYYKTCFLNHEEEVPGWQMFYACKDENGGYYIKNEKNYTQEEMDYVIALSYQDDAVEFNNRVNAEYNELMEANPQILAYLGELGKQVDAAIGVRLAEMNAASQEGAEGGEQAGEGTGEGGGESGQGETAVPATTGPQYAVATTTVNVRGSDSEQADRLGKVAEGTRIQVQEVRVNGWTKVVYDGKDGFIKSEYLQMEESADGQEAIGTVTANTNINVRSAASESAEVLGILPGGESLELLGNENGWCKVKYAGRVAYVKADYVTQG